MRSSIEIKENIADLRDELDAIMAISEREDREMNEDEQARVSAITEELIPKLNKQYKTAIAVEKERQQRSAKRFEEAIEAQLAGEGEVSGYGALPAGRFGGIKVPAKAKCYGKLQAFSGPDAERDAYVAGHVVLAGIFNKPASVEFCRNHGLIQNSMVSNDNGAGGFLVPDEMQRAIIRLREERGVFPQFANRVPMGSDIITVPRLLSDVTAYWVGEAAEITASDAGLGGAELMARKLGAITKVSTELDEDAVVEIGDTITQSMAYAMADKVDDAAFNGDGQSSYGGVLGLKNALHANAIADAASTHDSALELDLDDFHAVLAKYPQYTAASPRWFMHSAVYFDACHNLMAAAGGNTMMSLADGLQVPMFLGYPVTFVQVMPSNTGTLASTIVAYFGDLRLGAAYGVRRSVRTEVSRDRYFENDLVGIKTTERVAINIHERGDTIRNRPIVALKTSS